MLSLIIFYSKHVGTFMWTEKVKSVKDISHSKDAGTSFHKLKFERADSKTCAASFLIKLQMIRLESESKL